MPAAHGVQPSEGVDVSFGLAVPGSQVWHSLVPVFKYVVAGHVVLHTPIPINE